MAEESIAPKSILDREPATIRLPPKVLAAATKAFAPTLLVGTHIDSEKHRILEGLQKLAAASELGGIAAAVGGQQEAGAGLYAAGKLVSLASETLARWRTPKKERPRRVEDERLLVKAPALALATVEKVFVPTFFSARRAESRLGKAAMDVAIGTEAASFGAALSGNPEAAVVMYGVARTVSLITEAAEDVDLAGKIVSGGKKVVSGPRVVVSGIRGGAGSAASTVQEKIDFQQRAGLKLYKFADLASRGWDRTKRAGSVARSVPGGIINRIPHR